MSRKARKHSKAQAAIQAALEIAQEHARILEAANRNTDPNVATIPAPVAATK